jgi:hypothetical protein
VTEPKDPPAGAPASNEAVPMTGRKRDAPERPPVASPLAAPVLVKLTPPFSVRLSQVFWILSFAVGGFTAVYFFVIRQTQLPLIADVVRGVSEGRSDQTYETAAEIVFWVVFGLLVATLLTQITLLVSFMSRRPHVRWWQLATLVVQVLLLLLSMELVAVGEEGQQLRPLLAAECGLVVLALLWSVLPGAIAWSARQHDVRRGPQL